MYWMRLNALNFQGLGLMSQDHCSEKLYTALLVAVMDFKEVSNRDTTLAEHLQNHLAITGDTQILCMTCTYLFSPDL